MSHTDPFEWEPVDERLNKHRALYDLLVKRAGLTADVLAKGETDAEFGAILGALAAIRSGKEVLYGDYIVTHGSSPTALIEHYCDVKRKFVRAQGFMERRMRGEQIALEELVDTYSDLAVYSALGIKLLLHLMAKGKT